MTEKKRNLWNLGREVNACLAAENASVLRPNRNDLRKVAAGLGVSMAAATRAWTFYNFGC